MMSLTKKEAHSRKKENQPAEPCGEKSIFEEQKGCMKLRYRKGTSGVNHYSRGKLGLACLIVMGFIRSRI